jgi:hypothetical protein
LAYLILAGLVAALGAPFALVLIGIDMMLNERVRILHWFAVPFEWIAAAALIAGVLAFGAWLNVVTTRVIVRELVDIVRGRWTTGMLSHPVEFRKGETDHEPLCQEWDVEFTDSSGQRRTARYSSTPRPGHPIVAGMPIRVRYRPNRPEDQQRIRLRPLGAAPLIRETLLKMAFLGIWMVKISPLPALVFYLVVHGYPNVARRF